MTKLWFLGEALIDFVPAQSTAGSAFAPRCGGSPYNAAKAAAQAGAEVGFLGAISSDIFGDKLAADLAAHGVDISRAPRVADATTLAFVDLESGEPRYAFFNALTATSRMAPDASTFAGAPGDVVHVGSISLIDQPGADNIAKFAEEVAGRATLAIDPNARPGMIEDAREWRARIGRLADLAGIVKMSSEDLSFLAPGMSASDFAAAQIARGTGLVVVTRGADGAEAFTARGRVSRSGHRVTVADAVGAGDTVTGFLLAGLAERQLTGRDALAALDSESLAPVLELALAAAALNCTETGCAPPDRATAAGFLESSGMHRASV